MKNQLVEFLEDEEKEFEEDIISEVDSETTDGQDIKMASRKLHTSRQDKAIVDLFRMIQEKEICLSPDFQRRYVWTKGAASKFIESLLINIPIPTIFVSTTKDGTWDVVDGQQRLTAIAQFLNNDLKLSGLETLPELNKLYYKDLEEKTQKILNNRTLSLVIIDDDSSEDIKFDIFMRINQGSVKLNEQELRNCLYRGPFMNLIKELGKHQDFMNVLDTKQAFVRRFQHLEIIERFFLMHELIEPETFLLKEGSYGGRTMKSINHFLKERQFLDQDGLSVYASLFEQAMHKVYLVFGKNAFSQYVDDKYSYKINKAAAEMQLTLLSFLQEEQVEKYKVQIKQSFEKLMCEDKQFEQSLVRATNNTKVVNYRYNTWGKILKEMIEQA